LVAARDYKPSGGQEAGVGNEIVADGTGSVDSWEIPELAVGVVVTSCSGWEHTLMFAKERAYVQHS